MIKTNGKIYLTWDDIMAMIDNFICQINSKNKKYKQIVAISKGGFVPATIIANKLNIPVYAIGIKSYDGEQRREINEYQPLPDNFDFNDTLIVDDIADSGSTLLYIKEKYNLTSTTDFFVLMLGECNLNSDIIMQDFYFGNLTKGNWTVFPWER